MLWSDEAKNKLVDHRHVCQKRGLQPKNGALGFEVFRGCFAASCVVKANEIMNSMQQHKIKVFQWPSQSQDLNPIEMSVVSIEEGS